MQDYINKIEITLNELALIKKRRALDAMPDSFQHVFLLLPILLHYHDPKLPGYIDSPSIPFGISSYFPCDSILDKVHQSFGFSLDALTNNPDKISALYSMGSTCTLGQSVHSDLDVWICIEKTLSADEVSSLTQKCRLIEEWAASYDTQLTLFIVDVDRFKHQFNDCQLIGENCGSAQHMLLLEEFYRSANCLAGKPLLWYVIPADLTFNGKKYYSYNACIDALVDAKVIRRSDWIDFGSLTDLSAQEYFGASLWQLYKSIDSPFKAVLKTLLLEAYSFEYPNNQVLAFQVKSLIQHDDMRYSHLDSYCMMLDKVTTYLISIGDIARLDLVRGCFYLKINEKLSQPSEYTSWRRVLLTKLVAEWGWSQAVIKSLDDCESWKIEKARDANELLLKAMITGYRNLLHFGRRHNLDSLVNPQDLAVLTRKLYAAYEVLPGKVSMINPNITQNLCEDSLTFIHVKNDRVNRSGWYVYKQKPTLESIIGHQYLEYSSSLVKLVAWCYFNNLISDNTTFFYRNGDDKDPTKLNQFVTDLRAYFAIKVPSATEVALYNPCEIRHLAIIINLKEGKNHSINMSDFSHDLFDINVFNYGKNEVSLIQSINLLYRNSWNEVRVLRFSGDLCVLDATKALLNRMHKEADSPSAIQVFCYSEYFQNEIINQMKKWVDRCIELRLSVTENNSKQFIPLRIGGSSWYLFFERFGVSAHQFDNAIDFYGALSHQKVHGNALTISDEENKLPQEIDSVACEGIIQFFFREKESGFDLYILNENNQPEIYQNCNGDIDNMIQDVNHFYTLSDDRFSFTTSSSINFNLPQFYQILDDENNVKKIVPFNRSSFSV